MKYIINYFHTFTTNFREEDEPECMKIGNESSCHKVSQLITIINREEQGTSWKLFPKTTTNNSSILFNVI